MDMITIIAITNGIQYLYKFMKIAGIYYSSVEIFGKITIQQTVKHIDNVATIYDVSTFALALNQPSSHVKKKPIPKKKSNDKCMSRAYRFMSDMVHGMYVARLERQERQAERRKEILYSEKMKREKALDDEKEKELFGYGYLRDKISRHYISPSKMLTDINVSVMKQMSGDRYSNEDRTKVKNLITGSVKSETDFEPYRDLFYFVDISDRITKRPFQCDMLDVVYSPASIMYLQDKRDKLVYVNEKVIHYENRCVE